MDKGEKIALLGCGAQAKYAMETFFRTNREVSVIYDPIGGKVGHTWEGFLIRPMSEETGLPALSEEELAALCVLPCVSSNRLKKELFARFEPHVQFADAIHPKSIIARNATIGKGVIINPGAVIQPYARIGDGCMIHSGVVVEHDCVIEDYANIAPGVVMAGGVRIREGATVFTGTSLAPNVTVGRYTTVGAGSLVIKDLPDNVTAYGSPAGVVREEAG